MSPFNNSLLSDPVRKECLGVLLALGLALNPLAAIAANDCIEGNGKTASTNRKTGPFTTLSVDGIFDVEVTCGQPYDINVTADSNILPHVLTSADNGKLTITSARSICTKNPVTVKISVPSLKALLVEGSCDVSILKIDNESFDSKTDGSATVRLQGKTGKLNLKVEGSATVEAAGLQASEVKAQTFDSSDAEVQAVKSLDAECHDSSDLKYSGNPKSKTTQTFDACDLTAM